MQNAAAVQEQSAFGEVALARAKEAKTRLGVGLGLALIGAYMTTPVIGLTWYLAVLAGQFLDWAVFAPVRRNPNARIPTDRRWLCAASLVINSLIYSSMAYACWFLGNAAGQVFAMMLLCGSLLHTTLHAAREKMLLAASVGPHAMLAFALPVTSWIAGKTTGGDVGVILFGVVLYCAHLAIIVRQSALARDSLVAATKAHDAERKRAEQGNAAKSEFLATITHEIRTPMNAVMAAAHLLTRTRLTREQGEHVAMLNAAGETLLALLNDVLDMSKIEAGKMTVETIDFQVADDLDRAMRVWEPRARDKALTFQLEIAPDFPTAVRGDPLRTRQILFNLISNAVKFTEAGHIIVRAARETADDGEPMLVFTVEDTGPGMSAETLASLFREFQQGGRAIAREKGGTGLGLAISRRLAELLGGDLSAQSTLGAGSTFRLRLPYRPAAAAPARATESAETPQTARQLRVLVAEDQAVNQRIVALFLKPTGWDVVMTADGEEALEALSAGGFDVVLMDMQMPRLDGPEATQRLRASTGPNRDIPVIALTANAMEHHRATFMEAGADAFIAKPIDPRLLVQTILSVTGREASGSQAAA
jgi:signal transduction histidine kinase/ActR/RegA family two-component response regulator